MLCAHKFRLTHGGLSGHAFVHQAVATGHHVAGGRGALVNNDVLDRFATAQGNAFVNNRFQRQLFAAAQLVVGGDDRHGTGVLNTLLQALGRKTAKHHRVRCANAGAGLHGHHAFDRHRHVDDHTVALFHTHALEHIGKLADLGVQFLVGDVCHLAVIAFKDDGFLLFGSGAQMAIQAVVRSIDQAIVKPLVKRRFGLVQCAGERFFPAQVLAGQTGPVALKIRFGFFAQCIIGSHA